MGNAWKLSLWVIVYFILFSYKVDPARIYSNPEQIKDWRNALIDSAQLENQKLLTVSSMDDPTITIFKRPWKWSILMDSVTQLIKDRNADSVDLNFEQLPYISAKDSIFLKQFKEQLDNQINGKSQSFPSPTSSWRRNIRCGGVAKIRWFDGHHGLWLQREIRFKGSGSITFCEGSTSVWAIRWVLWAVVLILKNGFGLAHGSMWTGDMDENGEVNQSLNANTTRNHGCFQQNIANSNTTPFLDKSMTNYFNYHPDNSTGIWFDDDFTLEKSLTMPSAKI